MRIAFHLRYFQAGRIGGQEGVIRLLTAGLAARPLTADQELFALCPTAEREAVAKMCVWSRIVPVEMDASERQVRQTLRGIRPDLYVCPMAIVEPAEPSCPVVVGIPDLQHETYPEFFSPEILANRRRSYGHAIRRADLILTLSEHALRTILDCYPEIAPERVVVAPPGVDPAFEQLAAQDADSRDPYLLFPANFWPHKNHFRLLEAFARLRMEGVKPPLVLTGDPGSGFDRVQSEIKRLGLEDQVQFLGRVSTGQFVPLLRGARALVFPSLYEGFGLPILEAFHCDTPVLCSNVASCPEVAGDAALLVDPASVDAITQGLRRIWTDAELRAALVEKGKRRRAELQWDMTLEKIRAAMLNVVSRPTARPGPIARLLRTLGVGRLTP